MKLQSKITLVFRDKETGEVTRTVETKNHIQNWFLEEIVKPPYGGKRALNNRIFISELNPGKQSRDWGKSIKPAIGGANIAGITNGETIINWQPGIHLYQCIQRFEAPTTTDRIIRLIGLCNSVSSSGIASSAGAVAWLNTPCIQTTSETLDVYYRVQLKFDANWKNAAPDSDKFNADEAQQILEVFTINYLRYPLFSTTLYRFVQSKINFRKLAYNGIVLPTAKAALQDDSIITATSGTLIEDKEFYKTISSFTLPIDKGVGRIIGAYSNQPEGFFNKFRTDESPLQSVFGHRDTSTTPFYVSSTAPQSIANIAVNGDTWTDPSWPKYVKIKITADGLVGTGKYKFHMRNFFGFINNTFEKGLTALPTTSIVNAHYTEGFKIQKDEQDTTGNYVGNDVSYALYYSPTEVLFIWNDSFAKTDLRTGEGKKVDNTVLFGTATSPEFLATDINQICVDSNKDIWVACRTTGLYKLSADLSTITKIDANTSGLTGVLGCCGISEGGNGRIWTYWNHSNQPSLYYSDNSGATWTSAGYSDTYLDANPLSVFAIHADPSNADGKIGIGYLDPTSTTTTEYFSIKWWDQASITASDGPTAFWGVFSVATENSVTIKFGHRYQYQKVFRCSPTKGLWGAAAIGTNYNAYPGYFTFGTNTKTVMASTVDLGTMTLHTNFVYDPVKDTDAIIYCTKGGHTNNVTAYGNNVVMYFSDDTYEHAQFKYAASNSGDYSKAFGEYLGDGIFLYNWTNYQTPNIYAIIAVGQYNAPDITGTPSLKYQIYPEFGWDGSKWVRGHSGEKTIHSTTEELIDGVTVSFDDGSGANSFYATDHYTFALVDGVLLDGATTFTLELTSYIKPSQHNTEVEATTLPSTQKVPNKFISGMFSANTDLQDIVSFTANTANNIVANGTALDGDYNGGCRSVVPVIKGTISSFLPNQSFVPNSDINNAQGWIEWGVYKYGSDYFEGYTGISGSSVIGTTLDHTKIEHAIHVDTATNADNNKPIIRVTELGQERAKIVLDAIDVNLLWFRIVVRTNSSVLYQYRIYTDTDWLNLYESAPNSITIKDFYLDMNFVPKSNNGLEDFTYYVLDEANKDYYLYLGDGIDKGVFHPTFHAIDPDSVEITIDGTTAVHIGRDDNTTTLAANAYSVFPFGGVIRYSASDIGKTISAKYITISHE